MMRHDLSYYRKIQGTYGVQTAKDAQIRAARSYIQNAFQKSLNWETILVNQTDDYEVQVIPVTEDFNMKKIKNRI